MIDLKNFTHLLSATESAHVEHTISTDNMDSSAKLFVPFPMMFREVEKTVI